MSHRKRHDRSRRARTLKSVLAAVAAAVVVVGGGWYGWNRYSSSHTSASSVIMATVERGTFLHEVAGKGNAESAKNIDITCQVESNTGTTVIWIIPEGEMVEEGDELVLLDSSNLEDKVSTQQITCNSNAATVASSQASLRTAELSLEEYIEGTFEQNWMKIENSIYDAQENQKQAADTVRYTERLVQFGYTTVAQLEAEQVSEQKYLNTVRSNLLEQLVLLRYTSEKQITQLMASIETARAKLNSDTYTNELAKSRLEHYKQQLENCTIRAPQAGQVVYANQDSGRWSNESDMIKEGSTVRERQVLIRLPDPQQMQVKTMINESNIASVKVGMKAVIVFDALSSKTFTGTVIKVNQYPQITWMSSAKDYVCIVRLDDGAEDIRSGLTAEVKVIAQKIPNVLMLPVQCVVEVNGRNYVLQCSNRVWSCKEVRLGLSNDKQVIIEEGLDEGEKVVTGARQYKDKVVFPGPEEPSRFPKEEKPVVDVPDTTNEEAAEDSGGDSDAQRPGPGAGEGDQQPGERRRGPGGPGGGMPFANMLMDGKLEIASLPSELPEQVREMMKKADKDGDGFLDEKELKAMPRPSGRGGRGGPGGGMSGGSGGGMPGGGMPGGGMPGGGMPGGPSSDQEEGPKLPGGEEKPNAAAQDDDTDEVLARLEPLKKDFELTAMELCQRADEDSDKFITREELQSTFPEMAPFFDEWDRNGDGRLSRTDLVIGFCTSRITYQKLTATKQAEEEAEEEADKGPGGVKEFLDKDPSELFALVDSNGDNTWTEDELPKENGELYRTFLKKLDENHDGSVTHEEFSNGMKLLQSKMKGGGASGGAGAASAPRR